MDPWILFGFLMLLAIGLAVAEAFLPSHGVLGIAALLCALIGIGVCLAIDRWIGLGVLVGLLALSPFLGSLGVRLWEKSPVGKKMILTATTPQVESPRIEVGMKGKTVSMLRPMGEAAFGMLTAEVISELGSIPAGTEVAVVKVNPDGVATVRAIESSIAPSGIRENI